MHNHELMLEPVDLLNQDELESNWVSNELDASSLPSDTRTDSLDFRLIKLIQALDR